MLLSGNKPLVGDRLLVGQSVIINTSYKRLIMKTRSWKMSREQSDGEDSVVETEDGPVDVATAETEVNFRLPRWSDPGPELIPNDIPIVTGAVGAEANTPDLGQPRRLGPLCGPNRNGTNNYRPSELRDQAGYSR